MRILAPLALALGTLPALAADGPIERCRAAHDGDPDAHIACLEAALEGRDAPPAAERAAAKPAEIPAGLGAEQVMETRLQGDASPEPVSVRIVAASYDAQGFGTFQMEDGQVWRETEPAPPRHRLKPDAQYTARIERGRVRGYRMYVEGVRWMMKVRRLE
jgi:hypothetical protein